MTYELTPTFANTPQPLGPLERCEHRIYLKGYFEAEFEAIDLDDTLRPASRPIDCSRLSSLSFHIENSRAASGQPLTSLKLVTGNSLDGNNDIVLPTYPSDLIGSNLITTNSGGLATLAAYTAADASINLNPIPETYIQFLAAAADAAMTDLKIKIRGIYA